MPSFPSVCTQSHNLPQLLCGICHLFTFNCLYLAFVTLTPSLPLSQPETQGLSVSWHLLCWDRISYPACAFQLCPDAYFASSELPSQWLGVSCGRPNSLEEWGLARRTPAPLHPPHSHPALRSHLSHPSTSQARDPLSWELEEQGVMTSDWATYSYSLIFAEPLTSGLWRPLGPQPWAWMELWQGWHTYPPVTIFIHIPSILQEVHVDCHVSPVPRTRKTLHVFWLWLTHLSSMFSAHNYGFTASIWESSHLYQIYLCLLEKRRHFQNYLWAAHGLSLVSIWGV